jgi:hypothetical protein
MPVYDRRQPEHTFVRLVDRNAKLWDEFPVRTAATG